MKKTMTVNISGIVFHIDEDAYRKLDAYLGRIRRYFASETGSEEILSGIESRIAEIFREKKQDDRQVVTLEDVNEAISQLGEPSQISGDNDDQSEGSRHEKDHGFEGEAPKRLFRDPENKYIGGVCGGLGAYFQIDPTWVRVLFVILFFAYTFGLVLYIVLWIVMPKARTISDRMSMRGQRITLSSIEQSIKEDLRDIKKNLEDLSRGNV